MPEDVVRSITELAAPSIYNVAMYTRSGLDFTLSFLVTKIRDTIEVKAINRDENGMLAPFPVSSRDGLRAFLTGACETEEPTDIVIIVYRGTRELSQVLTLDYISTEFGDSLVRYEMIDEGIVDSRFSGSMWRTKESVADFTWEILKE